MSTSEAVSCRPSPHPRIREKRTGTQTAKGILIVSPLTKLIYLHG